MATSAILLDPGCDLLPKCVAQLLLGGLSMCDPRNQKDAQQNQSAEFIGQRAERMEQGSVVHSDCR